MIPPWVAPPADNAFLVASLWFQRGLGGGPPSCRWSPTRWSGHQLPVPPAPGPLGELGLLSSAGQCPASVSGRQPSLQTFGSGPLARWLPLLSVAWTVVVVAG